MAQNRRRRRSPSPEGEEEGDGRARKSRSKLQLRDADQVLRVVEARLEVVDAVKLVDLTDRYLFPPRAEGERNKDMGLRDYLRHLGFVVSKSSRDLRRA